MPRKSWSAKRERQYEHIKDSYEDRGVSEDEAKERAARTVNKQRSEHGETTTGRRRKRGR
jgi:plasmid stabilization system protein ParE